MQDAWRGARTGAWLLGLSLATGSAMAQSTPETQSLRREIDALRADYEARIQALEHRLQAAEAAVAAKPAPAPAAAAAAATPPPEPAAAAAVTPVAQAGASSRGLLDVSMILAGQYTHTGLDPSRYRIRGFQLPPDADIGAGTRGFSLAESELSFVANVDPYFRGVGIFSISPTDRIEAEEAYIQTTSLGHGLTLRAGRFFSAIGYLNSQHAHTWDFADAPLAYQAMLGGQFNDDGVQLAWLAPTDRFFELRAEAGRGRPFPGSNTPGNGAGAYALAAHVGDDIGDSQSWRAGLSMLHANASNQQLLASDRFGNDMTNAFSGSTRVWVADAVWKWAPNGNPVRQNLKVQGEFLHSTRDGSMVVDATGIAAPGPFRASQSGWYLQAAYQFMPRWRVGLRTERLDPGTPNFGLNTGFVGLDTGSAERNTLMFDYNPSEFSRIRLQVAQDRARPGGLSDTQWWLQYQMSLGVHGAHSF
jgi:hypothetical protein